jgi:hypothetical protein
MLQKLKTEIAECYQHALECRRWGNESSDSGTKQDHLDMERRWLQLAQLRICGAPFEPHRAIQQAQIREARIVSAPTRQFAPVFKYAALLLLLLVGAPNVSGN